jgi:hypothetical protein
MPILFRDYETRSTLDLCKVGAWRHACDPSTGIWCCAFAVDDGPIQLWVSGDPTLAELWKPRRTRRGSSPRSMTSSSAWSSSTSWGRVTAGR